jgi:hypothetical protein
MTDHELDLAVNAACETLTRRSDLKHALVLFVASAERARELLEQAMKERPDEIRTEDVQKTAKLLVIELENARLLRNLIRDHDYGDLAS